MLRKQIEAQRAEAMGVDEMEPKPMPKQAYQTVAVVWVTYSVLLGLFGGIFHPFFPIANAQMGHDYAYMLPAWFDGAIWFKNNGLQAPWFTPSFCAGQPFFPDPQSTFYSLPQFISFVLPPVETAYLTLLASASLMFWGGYLLMRKVFATGPVVAALVGGLLMFNGFLPHRILIGHITFHGFALVPWVALLLLTETRDRMSDLIAGCAAGLLLAYMMHSGLGTLVLAAGLAVIALALVFGLTGGSLSRFVARGAIAGVIGLTVAISKAWAIFSFLSNFPRTNYLLPGAASLGDALAVVGGGLFLPPEWAATLLQSKLTNVQWKLGPHEWAYNFGITAVVLFFAVVIRRLHLGKWRAGVTRRQFILWTLLMLCMAWPVAFNFYEPGWNAFLKEIPVINSTSTPLRWLVVFIPITAVSIGLLLDRAQWGKTGHLVAVVCLLGTVAQVALEPRESYLAQQYDVRPIVLADAMFKLGKLDPGVRELGATAEIQVDQTHLYLGSNDTFIAGVSQVFCYNPVFGYRLEKFSDANINPGSVLAEHNGYLNLKNPACYVYPKENNCKPGDLFQTDQLEQAKAFINYRPYKFEISSGQEWANRLTRGSLVLTGGMLLLWLSAAAYTSILKRKDCFWAAIRHRE